MAADDDYWRWRNAEDDRRRAADRAREQTNRLYDALRRGDHDTARWITGVPPADAGSDDTDAPEPAAPPTAGEQFHEHKQTLLFNLTLAFVLPEELREDWARRVERLDIELPEGGLAVIEQIGDEYRLAHRYQPTNFEVSQRMQWDYQVPRVGHEIQWLETLFRHVLTFE